MHKIIEVVIDSVHSAIAAAQGGADRVELCGNLFEGGTTPSTGTIEMVRNKIDIDLYVMIRPRGGDFLYSQLEFEIMKKDITSAKKSGVDGVVFGLLLEDGTIDTKRCQELILAAHPMKVTFHRAFDMTADPYKALEDLVELKFDRVLTSGQERTALEGIDLLAELVERAGNRITVMPGGGISDRNILKIQKLTKAKEFHVSGRQKVESKMIYRKNHVFMGGELRIDEYVTTVSSADAISMIKNKF